MQIKEFSQFSLRYPYINIFELDNLTIFINSHNKKTQVARPTLYGFLHLIPESHAFRVNSHQPNFILSCFISPPATCPSWIFKQMSISPFLTISFALRLISSKIWASLGSLIYSLEGERDLDFSLCKIGDTADCFFDYINNPILAAQHIEISSSSYFRPILSS